MPKPDNARRRFLFGIFVMSGFTGLIYESIWSHYLRLFLGHAAYAQALVLAVAARDAQEIASGAAPLLEASSAPSQDERTYLTSVLATAYLRLGQMP